MVTRWRWGERAEAWDLSQVKSVEELFRDEADKFREDERKVLRMLFVKLAQRVQMLRPEELSPDGVSYSMLAISKALEKCYGLENKKLRSRAEDEDDEEFTEGLANFRRLQNQAIKTFQRRAAKATGTDGQVQPIPAAALPATPTQKKQPANDPPQRKEIHLFSR